MQLLLNPGTADPEKTNKKRLPQKFKGWAANSSGLHFRLWAGLAPHVGSPPTLVCSYHRSYHHPGSFREVAGRSQLVIFTCNSCFLSLLSSNQNPEASGHTLLACVGGKGPKVGLLGMHRTPRPVPLEGVLFARGGSQGTELGSSAASHFGNLNDRED